MEDVAELFIVFFASEIPIDGLNDNFELSPAYEIDRDPAPTSAFTCPELILVTDNSPTFILVAFPKSLICAVFATSSVFVALAPAPDSAIALPSPSFLEIDNANEAAAVVVSITSLLLLVISTFSASVNLFVVICAVIAPFIVLSAITAPMLADVVDELSNPLAIASDPAPIFASKVLLLSAFTCAPLFPSISPALISAFIDAFILFLLPAPPPDNAKVFDPPWAALIVTASAKALICAVLVASILILSFT